MKTPSIAIDFGTIRTKVAYFDERHGEARIVEMSPGQQFIPSVFYVPKEGGGEILFGEDARKMADADPMGRVGDLKAEILKGKKRLGNDRIKRAIEPIELAALLFKYIRQRCQQDLFEDREIDACRLSMPITLHDAQRKFIVEAARQGGFRATTTIEAPVAAAHCWKNSGRGVEDYLTICDVGCGASFTLLRRVDGVFRTYDEVGPVSLKFPDSDEDGTGGIGFATWVADQARCFTETCVKKQVLNAPILLTGGGFQTPGLKKALEDLKSGSVHVWEHSEFASVLGAVEIPEKAARASTLVWEKYGDALKLCWLDKEIQPSEAEYLRQQRKSWGIAPNEAEKIERQFLDGATLEETLRNQGVQANTTRRIALLKEIENDLKDVRLAVKAGWTWIYHIKKVHQIRIDRWETGAKVGSAEAEWLLGVCRAMGFGIAKDEAEAVRLFRQAAPKPLRAVTSKGSRCWAAAIFQESAWRRTRRRLWVGFAEPRTAGVLQVASFWRSATKAELGHLWRRRSLPTCAHG